MTHCNRRRGVSAAEVLIISVIISGGLIPIYLLFQKSGETEYRNAIAYKAIHVARAELEELRAMRTQVLGGPGMDSAYEGHDWEPVWDPATKQGKHLFHRYNVGKGFASGVDREELRYPDSYRGIETRVVLKAPVGVDPDSGIVQNTRIVRLEVRWAMAGQANAQGKRGNQVYHEVISFRPGG